MKGTQEMNTNLDFASQAFAENTPTDDIAILANLLTQIRDNAPEKCLDSVTAYDEKTRTDYGIDDIILYLRGKYGENFC